MQKRKESGDAWQHLHTIGCFATALSLIQSPPLRPLFPQFPFSEAFSNTFAAFANTPPLPENMHQRISFMELQRKGGNAIVAIFYFASSCKWSKVHHNIKLLRHSHSGFTYQHQNVHVKYISSLSDFEDFLSGLEFLGQKSPNLATTTSIVTVYFSQTMFV